jgi:hypothetical protein
LNIDIFIIRLSIYASITYHCESPVPLSTGCVTISVSMGVTGISGVVQVSVTHSGIVSVDSVPVPDSPV